MRLYVVLRPENSFYIPDNILGQKNYSSGIQVADEEGGLINYYRVVSVWSTDPIINITGLQYSDSDTKYAYVKIKPSELKPISNKYTFDAFLIVNLKEKKIEGSEFIKRKIPLTQFYYARMLE